MAKLPSLHALPVGGPQDLDIDPETGIDPDFILKNYRHWPYSDELLFEFLEDQSSVSFAILDLETTELISDFDRATLFREMTVSVAGVLLVEVVDGDEGGAGELGTYYSFWNDGVERGAPLKFLYHILDHALGIVAYNGKSFDLQVLAGSRLRSQDRSLGDSWFKTWQGKLFDPFNRLQRAGYGMIGLGKLLALNGIDPKSGKGADAPKLWARDQFDELESYCRRDVEALAEIVLLPSAIVQEHANPTSLISLRARPPTEQLTQGSSAWFAARKGKLTASLAPALLGYMYFMPPSEALQIVLGKGINVENVHMARGNRLEPVAADAFAKIWNGRVQVTGLFVHPLYPWLAASPDRLLDGSLDGHPETALLEIKAPTQTRTPSDSQMIQVTLQMACTGRATCYLMQFVESASGGQPTIRIDKITYDKTLFDSLVAELEPLHVIVSAAERGEDPSSNVDARRAKAVLAVPLKQARRDSMIRFL